MYCAINCDLVIILTLYNGYNLVLLHQRNARRHHPYQRTPQASNEYMGGVPTSYLCGLGSIPGTTGFQVRQDTQYPTAVQAFQGTAGGMGGPQSDQPYWRGRQLTWQSSEYTDQVNNDDNGNTNDNRDNDLQRVPSMTDPGRHYRYSSDQSHQGPTPVHPPPKKSAIQERVRRQSLTEAFKKLKEVLPENLPTSTHLQTLHSAMIHIEELEQRLHVRKPGQRGQ